MCDIFPSVSLPLTMVRLSVAVAALLLLSCSENVSKQRGQARELLEEREHELTLARAHLELLSKYGLDVARARTALAEAEQAINESRPLLEREFQRGRRRDAELAVSRRRTALTARTDAVWSAIDDVERAAPAIVLDAEVELRLFTKSGDLDLQAIDLVKLELAARQCRGKGRLAVSFRIPGDPEENAEAQALDNDLKLATALGSKSPIDKAGLFSMNRAVLGADVARNALDRFLTDVHAPIDARPNVGLERAHVKSLTAVMGTCDAAR